MTTIPSGRLPCVWAVGIALACSDFPETPPHITVTDSSGITIVHNRAPHRSGVEAWTIAETPSLDLGGTATDPTQELFRVAGAMRLDDGRIVVANAGTAELRFFAEDGTFLRAVGARGGGPGEFQALSGLRRYGPDSIAVFDSELRRLTVYDLTGNLGRSATLLTGEGGGLPQLGATFGVFGDGTLFLSTLDVFSAQRQAGAMRGTEPSFHVSETGTLLDSVGAFPGREMFIQAAGGGVRTTVRIFGRSTFYAVFGDHFFVGTNDRYEIARYSPTGALHTLIRRDHPRRPVRRGDREAFMQARLEGRSPADRQAYERRYDGNEPPSTFPAFAELIADRSGHLWVSNYPIPTEERRWFSVFDPDGRWVTDVAVLDGLSILDIGLDYVLALFTDELDVAHVGLYALDRN